MPDHPAVATAFLGHARRAPDAPALVWADREIGYRELADLAYGQRPLLDRLAPGEPAGILTPKSPGGLALILACLLTGRRFLLPSPSLAADTLDTLFAQAGCRTILREADLRGPAAGGPEHAWPAVDRDSAGFMLTTSGSTGLPKIVPLPHRSVDAFAAWAGAAFGIGPGRSVFSYAPLNFDLCLLDIWTTLAHGGRVVLADTERAAHGGYLRELLRRYPVDVIQGVPMLYDLLLDTGAGAFARVRHVLFTGDVIGERTLAALPGLFPGARLHNVYGCTETNDSLIAEVPPGHTVPVPLGVPLPGVDILILDEDGRPVDGPGTGELYVTTPFQSAGYLDAARNVGRFTGHPLGADARSWFRSGDLVQRQPDGTVTLVGRTDFQIKIRGTAINTAEVESVLRGCVGVLDAAVLTRTDPVSGRQLAAVVTRAPGSTVNSLVVRRHCAANLPKAAVPSTLRIVDEPLPRTSTGKLDRSAAEELLTPAPISGRTS
ncbi:AMP-binding protein [Actinoplanes derwentensis]|uniref:Acyl-CoA synthetase (AMP-forming)/AMP-acid ligase II n=1 Tax=Actinoplanes derwentensis TaxID=113562 RepID=A0A1H1R9M5_9ACTN|nr:AMP-binding protein [Actinoplanes derwentensis]GID88053.1 hypothetical protein Ade03nite_69770 [Actinoplanes derwentensis]SDS32494.1 Acyl-CoA synthetase (AMP-forming)/AMP-acid ligase II [Actinoplanes derwentensis]